jgi:phosphoglycolate phosphatase
MGKRFDLIIFDWDGTLMDSAALIADSVQAAARDLGLPVPDDERARHIIGLGLVDALRYAMPELRPERYQDAAARYRHHYLSRDHQLSLFAGAEELVAELARGERFLAVATGKSRVGLDRALAESGLGTYFHATRCADECHSKPHPQMVEELMAEFGAMPEATLMVGDTIHDLQMAKNAGIPSLAVSYGAHPRALLESESPLHCADSVAEMAAWLRANA